MTVRTTRSTVSHVDLNDPRFSSLPADQRSWLGRELGERPRFEDITSLLSRPGLTTAERSILTALRGSLVGDTRARQGRAFGAQGTLSLTDLRALTLSAAQAPGGKTPLEERLEAELPSSFLGHESAVPAFVEVARRYGSPARQTPVLMAVMGREGHGKSEALHAFKDVVLGPQAEVVTVDLRDYSSASMPGATASGVLFGKGGPLSVEVLKQRDPSYQPPPPDPDKPQEPLKPGLIVIRGAEDLIKNDRATAEGLARLLSARRSSPDYTNVIFVLDLDRPPTDDLRQQVVGALGVVGSRHLADGAVFRDLTGEVLMEYAEPILKESLSVPGMQKLVLEMDDEAYDVLQRALATPHAPLDELEPRLYEFLLSKFDTQPNVDREAAVLRVSLDPRFTLNPAELAALLQKLHEPYADLKLGSELFLVSLVARQVESTEELEIALRHGRALASELELRSAQLATAIPPVGEGPESLMGDVVFAIADLGKVLGQAMKLAQKNFELLAEEVLPNEHLQTVSAARARLHAELARLDTDAAEGLPVGLLDAVCEAAQRWLDGTRLVCDTLAGQTPESGAA